MPVTLGPAGVSVATHRTLALLLIVIAAALTLAGLIAPSSVVHAGAASTGLHTQGNQIVNGAGQPVHLYGVDRAGTEYACSQGWGLSDGPSDQASLQPIVAWHANAVRVPLNEDCWLGINGVNAAYAGANYQQAIQGYVQLLEQQGLTPILDLHLVAPGGSLANYPQQPMPDRDHSVTFWSQVAGAYKNDSAVVFDLFNEPFPDSDQDTTAAWQCWRDGGTCPGVSYQAAGMQELVNAVRGAGARNLIMIGGIRYANVLTHWLDYRPFDPGNNLAVAWHAYNVNACRDTGCWDSTVAPVMQQFPLIAGEIGEYDCGNWFVNMLTSWLDQHGGNYLAWAWDAGTSWPCGSANASAGPSLISDYQGTPTQAYGQAVHDHFAALSSASPTATATPSSSPTNTPTPTIAATSTSTPIPTATPSPSPSPSPTLTPSPSPSSTPTVTTALQVAQSTWTSTRRIRPGGYLIIQTTVRVTAGTLTNGILDIDVYNEANQKVGQHAVEGQYLSAGQSATNVYFWQAPSTPGVYTVAVGTFGPNWSPTYAWRIPAAYITVG